MCLLAPTLPCSLSSKVILYFSSTWSPCTTQTNKIIQIPGNWKQKIITGISNPTPSNKAEKVTSKDQTETIVKANKTSLVKNNMYPLRKTPLYVHEINSTSHMVKDLLKRAISNGFRHGINLKPGKLTNADGNCVWESITYNTLYRECFKSKTKETSKQLRKRSLDIAQSESHWLPFIE